jgi:hypothetical protein
MKQKITIIKHVFIFFLLGCVSLLKAQEKETLTVPLSNPGKEGKLVVHVIDGSIIVNGYDGNDVVVIAQGRTKSNKWHKSKSKSKSKYKNGDKSTIGMKRITDNGLSYTVEEINNTVYIKYPPGGLMIDFEVKVPRNFSVDLKSVNNGIILVDNVNGTHEASNTNGAITMTNVGGSVVADALNKDIMVTFSAITANTTMMFTSLNGDIDITFPSDLKANVNARSDFGNVYTDFEITLDKTKPTTKKTKKSGVYQVKREKGISGAINGGGGDITFKTLNGDILIRSN